MNRSAAATLVLGVIACSCGGPTSGAAGPESVATSSAPKPSRPLPEPEPEPDGASTEPSSPCPEGMVQISGANVWIGSPAGQGHDDEREQFQSDVRDFCIGVHEVTVAEYAACAKNAICPPLPEDVQLSEPEPDKKAEGDKPKAPVDPRSLACSARRKDNASLPANCVDQDDAEKYCAWKGARLPSELELEFVAMSGADKLVYPWGSGAPDDNRLCWKQKEGPCLVETKPKATFGLSDVAGNVSEWTSTLYGPYPTPPKTGVKVVVRGASWRTTTADDVRAKRRQWRDPWIRDADLGFRCAKDH